MSDGPSTQDHRITKADFRPCSTRRSRSQAGLCLYTQRPVSNRAEPTIARLRYSFGGDRPSQTTYHALSWQRLHAAQLEPRDIKGGISRLTPPKLAPRLQSLPPILHMMPPSPKRSYSKGPRGLSVLLRLLGILTENSTSLSPWLRQWGSRYAIRAGRNFMILLQNSNKSSKAELTHHYWWHRLYLHLTAAS